jgi:site-specific DNA-methyltransferase (adenine-specific)
MNISGITTFNPALIQGDCLDVLRSIPSNSIDSVVTDAPGGLDIMGQSWDSNKGGRKEWIAWLTAILVEVRRVLKPGGHMAMWTYHKTGHWVRTAMEDAGFEIVHTLIHMFGTGKSHGKIVNSTDNPEFNGYSTTLKTSHEEWVLVRKPLDGTVADNLAKWGVGALNVNACAVVGEPRQPPRFPGTLLQDGSDEVLKMFPDAPGQLAPLRCDGAPMKKRLYSKMKHGKEARPPRVDTTESSSRYFYCTKASPTDMNEGLPAGEINPHPTVKSTRLMRWICRLITPPGGIILDIFMGSGSTGKAAALEGFRFVGCDLSAEYVAVARQRIAYAVAMCYLAEAA